MMPQTATTGGTIDAANQAQQKARCPTDNSTMFYYTAQGISARCRHCKQIQVLTWEEILNKYKQLHIAM